TVTPRRSSAGVRRTQPSPPRRTPRDKDTVSDSATSPELVQRARAIVEREIDFRYHASFEKARDLDSADDLLAEVESLRTSTAVASAEPVRTSVLPRALAKLCRTPPLTPEQEQRCFRLMNSLKYRANALRSTVDP